VQLYDFLCRIKNLRGGEKLVAIAEIKASEWDAMTPTAVRRNVKRQARQIWSYIESQLEVRGGYHLGSYSQIDQKTSIALT